MSNRKYFDTNLVSITSGGSLVLNGIDYSVIGSRPSLLLGLNVEKYCGFYKTHMNKPES